MIELFAALLLGEAAAEAPAPILQKPLSERAASFLADFDIDPAPVECIDEFSGGRAKRIDRTIWLDAFHLAYEMEDSGFYLNELTGRNGCRGGKNIAISYERVKKNFRDGICAGEGVLTSTSGLSPGVPVGRCKLGYFFRLIRKSTGDAEDVTP